MITKLLLKTLHQFRIGEILSAIGFAAYVAGTALGFSDTTMVVVLAIFSLISVWTLLSLFLLPAEQKKSVITPSFTIGQTAVTILLVSCLVLTIRVIAGI